MRLFIYDVKESSETMFSQSDERDLFFSASPQVKHCIGCFGCWIKTPGQCVIQDRCTVIPSYFSQCNEVIIISPLLYGGYSQKIKAVLDRSIGYILPYFRYVNKEMHHQMRYKNQFKLSVHFYGTCDEGQMDIARRLVTANGVNWGAESNSVQFYKSEEDIAAAILPASPGIINGAKASEWSLS